MARIMGDEFSGAFDTLAERERGVTIGLFKSPVCCAVVIKAISLQKEYKHTLYTHYAACSSFSGY